MNQLPVYHCPKCEYEWKTLILPPRQPKKCPACTYRLKAGVKWPRAENEERRSATKADAVQVFQGAIQKLRIQED
ncbi:MAG: hypothetical protein V3V32_04350 [Dehalococcoidia bacterium]